MADLLASGGNSQPSSNAFADLLSKAKHIAKAVPTAATLPMQTTNAVLGAPQRAIAGAMAEGAKQGMRVGSPGLGRYANPLQAALGEAGGAAYGVFHPNDESVQNQAERALGLDHLKRSGTSFRDKAQNFAVDAGFQTLTDPLTYIPAAWAGKGIEAAAKAATKPVSTTTVGRIAQGLFQPDHLVRQVYSGHDLNVYEGVVDQWKGIERKWADRDVQYMNQALNGNVADLQRRIRQANNMGFRVVDPGTYTRQTISALGNQLAHARAAARERMIEKTVEKHGLQYIQNPMRPATQFEQWAQSQGVPELAKAQKWLENAGGAYKNALFINGAPHAANIGVLQAIHQGLPRVAEGVGNAVRGAENLPATLPGFKNLQQEMERHGATMHYSAPAASGLDRLPGVGPAFYNARKFSQGLLDRFETGQRAANYAHYRKDGMDPFDAASNTRRELGDYTNTSLATRMLSAAGGRFPQWRLAAVPVSMSKALVTNPRRVEQYARAETLANQDGFQNTPYELEFGKPPDDFGKLTSDPASAADYLVSSSTIGPAGDVIGNLRYHTPIGGMLEQQASEYIPYASYVEALSNLQPFQRKAPKDISLPLSLVGAYLKNKPKRHQ